MVKILIRTTGGGEMTFGQCPTIP